MVELVGVRKRHRRVGEVLRGVDLRPGTGVVTVLAGANGTGKSTLLRIAAGASSPSSGRVRGRPAVVGYLPAPFPASSRLSVRAYLRHAAAMHGAPGATGSALLAELGFDGALDGPVTACSTGNAQKVGLAQALAPAPGLLVLDEPWTGLDGDAANGLDRRLVAAARGATVMVADHSGRGAALPGAVVLVLEGGVLHAWAPPPSGAGERAVIELWCPASPGETLRRLPPVDAARCGDATVTVELDAARGDALLAAALDAGCSVLAVRRER